MTSPATELRAAKEREASLISERAKFLSQEKTFNDQIEAERAKIAAIEARVAAEEKRRACRAVAADASERARVAEGIDAHLAAAVDGLRVLSKMVQEANRATGLPPLRAYQLSSVTVLETATMGTDWQLRTVPMNSRLTMAKVIAGYNASIEAISGGRVVQAPDERVDLNAVMRSRIPDEAGRAAFDEFSGRER